MNEMEHAEQLLMRCRDACAALLDRGKARDEISNAIRDQLRETTTFLEAELAGPTSVDRAGSRFGFLRRLLAWPRWGWLLFYAGSVAGVIWWLQVRPTWDAMRQLQGVWQYTTGVGPEERLDEVYFQVVGSETCLTYPLRGKWTANRSRISIRPADDFFIVRREFGFRNKRETEYIIRLANDHLYLVRGMAKLDAMRERSIEKLRSIKELPAPAQRTIDSSKSE